MCGINLLVHPQAEEKHLQQMQRMLQHRGPDAEQHVRLPWADATLLMGTTRLKVQGLSNTANQPMQCTTGGKPGTRYTLCYNGEIYNQYELRNALISLGFSFRTQSDTEVLLYGLIAWGKTVLTRLNGMFAFAFFDAAENYLLLARDRQGMKPLYYHRQDGRLFVASETRSLFASGLLKKQLNEDQLQHFLHFRYAKAPETFFRQVYQLMPGHLLELRDSNDPALPDCWAKPSQAVPEKATAEDTLTQLEEKLTDAAFRHIQSDRPVAMLLSGGVDSTLLLALMRKESSYRLPVCYGIGTDAQTAKVVGNTDLEWAERAAKQYDAPFEKVLLSEDVLNDFPKFVAGFDQPIADSAALFLQRICKQIADNGQVVVLNGAGADEYFAGYNRHIAWQKYSRNPAGLHRLLQLSTPLLGLIPSGVSTSLTERKRLLQRLATSISLDQQQTFANMLSLKPPAPAGLLAKLTERNNSPEAWLEAALSHDREHYLVQDLLRLNDTIGMQHSLEMRMPYLDREVITFAEQQAVTTLLRSGRKWMLKEVLSGLGGKAFANRRKQGFSAPFGRWVQQGKTEALWAWLQQPACPAFTYLPVQEIKKQLLLHKEGKAAVGEWLFGVAVLSCWLNQQFS